MKTTADIRQAFLTYFEQHQHEVVASSSLIPANDPTLLFTNAGMVQFKDVFLGNETRRYHRATSSQRCVRAGGKHNDLENVGYTARHHTFFEMLGNFSFGDYFKQDAIRYAWDFLTNVVGLSADKLWVTVFDEDEEAAGIWLNEIKVDPNRLSRIGAKDNFWSMGATGPCGPCTEIFYDHGEDVPGGPPGTPEEDGDRYVEIWNLVFMQYNRNEEGVLTPLPKPSVDTGMGLERVAAVVQGVHSNYDTDLFQGLITAAANIVGVDDKRHNSLKVIADHIRSCSFMVIDGVLPSNEGAGYVLRRIIRRAIRHGYKLGVDTFFFYKLVDELAVQMGEAYPGLNEKKASIAAVLKKEENRFSETLEKGMKILEEALSKLTDKTIPGEVVFKLYDTYGFPYDLTADIARERELILDKAGFDSAMAQQKAKGKKAGSFDANLSLDIEVAETQFTGYQHHTGQGCVLGVVGEDQKGVESLTVGQKGGVVLDQTPFYAESGGQCGDVGQITFEGGSFTVTSTKKLGKIFLHIGELTAGELSVGCQVTAEIDVTNRQYTELNHSATHIMHAALRAVLGDHVAQKGSRVDAELLRFDFSHTDPVTSDEMAKIESMVNEQIRHNAAAETKLMDIDAARASGAMALFGEKYDDEVRVLSIGDFSVELCGGTHVERAGDIGLFKITAETGVASGVRRIEAVTGPRAIEWLSSMEGTIDTIASIVKGGRNSVFEKVKSLVGQNKQLEKTVAQLKAKQASQAGSDLVSQAIDVGGVKLLTAKLDGVDGKSLREMADQLKNKLGDGIVVLAAVDGDKVSLVVGVTKELTKKVKAGNLVSMVAQQVGGKGGGRPDMAMAGGKQPENVESALNSVKAWVEEQLG
ncbi:MAG: alanine--tRNA ligase [Methylococcales bacterium]|nr:alanine--tRNA ligase [Methylococcales bacterium]